MAKDRSFIPRDKPRFWVLFVLACLSGMGFGLIAFAAASAELSLLAIPMMIAFSICWLVAAVSFLGYMFGIFSGRYRNLRSRAWTEQVW